MSAPQAVRAYLSPVDGWRLRCGTNQLDGLAEAARILADTQPDHAQSGTAVYHSGHVGPAKARRYLRAALSAFIGDEAGL